MKVHRAMLLLAVAAMLATLPDRSNSQSVAVVDSSSGAELTTASLKLDRTYVRPTQRIMVRNYAFDAFGPYPISGAAVAAGINQFTNSPPEWNQGVEGYSS